MREEATGFKVPIIKLWGQLLVSLQGEILDSTASVLFIDVLEEIHKHHAQGLVLDVSGVPLIDSHLCSIIGNLGAAAKLMGTSTVLCGLSPQISLTLQSMGIELHQVKTTQNLEEALAFLGIVAKKKEEQDPWALLDDILASSK
jgi:rsbT antagonist protein RsbS